MKRAGIWLAVILGIVIEVGACHDVGGGAEHAPVDPANVLLND